MHCTTSGAPGSLLPDVVLSSPLSHRSEYCSPERLVSSLLSRLFFMSFSGVGASLLHCLMHAGIQLGVWLCPASP